MFPVTEHRSSDYGLYVNVVCGESEEGTMRNLMRSALNILHYLLEEKQGALKGEMGKAKGKIRRA